MSYDELSLHFSISRHLEKIAELFLNPKITLIVRAPGNDEGDVVLTNDTTDEAMKALERTKIRKARGGGG